MTGYNKFQFQFQFPLPLLPCVGFIKRWSKVPLRKHQKFKSKFLQIVYYRASCEEIALCIEVYIAREFLKVRLIVTAALCLLRREVSAWLVSREWG